MQSSSPCFLHPSTVVHQGVELFHSLGQLYVHLGTNTSVAHIRLEGGNHSRWMDVRDVPVDSAESLQILPESLSFFLLEELQIAGLTWFLKASSEGPNELMTHVSP